MDEIIEVADKLGAVAALLLMVWGFMRGWLVPGYIYNQMRQDRDRWKTLAIRWKGLEAPDAPRGKPG